MAPLRQPSGLVVLTDMLNDSQKPITEAVAVEGILNGDFHRVRLLDAIKFGKFQANKGESFLVPAQVHAYMLQQIAHLPTLVEVMGTKQPLALASVPGVPSGTPALERLKQRLDKGSSASAAAASDLWDELISRVKALVCWDGDFHSQRLTFEGLLKWISDLSSVVADFAEAAYQTASHREIPAIRALNRGFGEFAELFDCPRRHSGTFHSQNYDLFQFLGNEMFVCLIAGLLKYEVWDVFPDLLQEAWGIDRHRQPMTYANQLSDYLNLLSDRQQPDTRGELLRQRHSGDSRLAKACPLKDFQSAEFFLLWHFHSKPDPGGDARWVPWSLAVIPQPPNFLGRATSKKFSQELLAAFGVASIEELRQGLRSAYDQLRAYFPERRYSLSDLGDPRSIGSH